MLKNLVLVGVISFATKVSSATVSNRKDAVANREWKSTDSELEEGHTDADERRLNTAGASGRGSTSFISAFRLFEERNIVGRDLLPSVQDVNSVDSCALICLDRLEEGCTGFTWVSISGNLRNMCFPKTGYLAQADFMREPQGSRIESGFIQPTTVIDNSRAYRTYIDRDYFGYDLELIDDVSSPEECGRLMIENSEATGFTWLGENTLAPNRCHLKMGALILNHLSDFQRAVSGFSDNIQMSSDFRYFDAEFYRQINFPRYYTEQVFSDDPLECSRICRERYVEGCRGFNWALSRLPGIVPRFSGACLFLGGALTGRYLDRDKSHTVFGMLQPVCSRGYRVYSASAISNDRLASSTAIPTEAECRSSFEEGDFSFYSFRLVSFGNGECNMYRGTFDLNLLVLDDSSSTSVPCGTPVCSGGYNVFSNRAVSRLRARASVDRRDITESDCRAITPANSPFYTYYFFQSTGGGLGRCRKYLGTFNQRVLVNDQSGRSWTAVRCEPDSTL